MAVLTNFETGGDSETPIGDFGTVEYRCAQSFQLSGSADVGSVEINIKKYNSISSAVTVRIETDNAGSPSGTLANASATTTITPTATDYTWVVATFPAKFQLNASTTYWIVCSVPAQSTNDYYGWYRDAGNGYASGQMKFTADAGGWDGAGNGYDQYFRVNSPTLAEGYSFFM